MSESSKKYWFFSKNDDGTYTYFGRIRKSKPYWFFGKRSAVATVLIFIALWLNSSESLGPGMKSFVAKSFFALILTMIAAIIYYVDWREYRNI